MDQETRDAVRGEVSKLAVSIGSAMSVLAVMMLQTGGEGMNKAWMTTLFRQYAGKYRAAGDAVSAALLEQLAQRIDELK